MHIFLDKVLRVAHRKIDALVGSLAFDLEATLETMASRPFQLHLELTNICNAKCLFCPYQYQERKEDFMPDEVFEKAVGDYVDTGGGTVILTPIVGEALIDKQFLDRVRYLRAQPKVDRIELTTNGILLDRFGIDEMLTSGLTTINISTSGFEEESYKRIYQSSAYVRMRDNVTRLVERNAELGNPVNVWVCLRTDRPLEAVLKDPDMQPILKFNPQIDFTWSFTSAGGRITREELPEGMRLRTVGAKKEACVSLYNGPIVLPDGTVLACSCVAAMDAVPDLKIGHILEDTLQNIYTGFQMKNLRDQFGPGCALNETCRKCDMYRDLEMYRTGEGRQRARLNEQRLKGEVVKRSDRANTPFSGG